MTAMSLWAPPQAAFDSKSFKSGCHLTFFFSTFDTAPAASGPSGCGTPVGVGWSSLSGSLREIDSR